VSHSALPDDAISAAIGLPGRGHSEIDAQLHRITVARWLFNEYGAQRLRDQVIDVLNDLIDELLDERLIADAYR
jgi:hypothetical protein